MNDNNFRPTEYSRAYSEALWIAIDATRSDAQSMKTSLETDPQCVGHVAMVLETKMMADNESADLLEGQLKRHGHRDFLKRMRESGNPTFRIS